MSRPKEPKKFLYPRVYFQPTKYITYSNRIRIIEPSGKCSWIGEGLEYFHPPCWAADSVKNLDRWFYFPNNDGFCDSGKEAVRLMKKYDRAIGYRRAIFIGEIR